MRTAEAAEGHCQITIFSTSHHLRPATSTFSLHRLTPKQGKVYSIVSMPPSLREAGKPCSVTRVAHRALFTTTKTPNLWFDNSIQPSAILDQLAFFLFPFFWQYSKFFIVDVTSGDVLLHELMKYVDHVALRKNDFGNSFKMCRKKGGLGVGKGRGLDWVPSPFIFVPLPLSFCKTKWFMSPYNCVALWTPGEEWHFFLFFFI